MASARIFASRHSFSLGLGAFALAACGLTVMACSGGSHRGFFGAPPAPAATQLAFVVQPSSALAGASLSPAVQVEIRDAGGARVVGSTLAVTLAISPGTGTSGAVLSGSLTVSAVGGVATFAGLSVNLAGTGYALTGDATALTSATSAAFDVSAATALAWINPGPGAGSDLISGIFDPANANTFYYGGDIEGPFKSTDGGASYARVSVGLAGGDRTANAYASQQLLADPSTSSTIYLATWEGLYRSTDSAATWALLDPATLNPAFARPFATVAVSPTSSSIILIGVGDGEGNVDGESLIRRSIDGGVSFADVDLSALVGATVVVHKLAFDPNTTGRVYAATGGGVLVSADDGATWSASSTGLPPGTGGAPVVQELIAVPDAASATTVLFCSLRTQSTTVWDAGGVFRSLDAGATWADVSGNLPTVGGASGLSYCYWRLATPASDASVLYVGTRGPDWAWDQMGVYKSGNALAATASTVSYAWNWDDANFTNPAIWTDLSWLGPPWWNDKHVHVLAVAPSDPNVLFAGADSLYKTTDAGGTWTEAFSSSQAAPNTYMGRGAEMMEVFDVAVHPTDPNVWWVGYDDMGLWRTDDGGVTFVRMDALQGPDPANPGAPVNQTDAVHRIAVDPTDPTILYVSRNDGDNDFMINWAFGFVYKSTDAGATWSQLGAGVVEGGRPELMLLPGGTTTTRALLCAVYGKGLYRTADSGATWTEVGAAAFSAYDKAHLWALAYDPGTPSVVYAGVTDGSDTGALVNGAIYKSLDSGVTWSQLVGATVPTAQILDLEVAGDGTLYAATTSISGVLETGTGVHRGGLYRSADGGATFSRVLSQARVEAVSVRPGDPTRVVAVVSAGYNYLAGVASGSYMSRDSGASFALESSGITHSSFWFVKYHPLSTGRVFAGTKGGGLFVASGGDS